MIRLPINRLKEGMITAQSIYNHSGASYLTRGSALSRQYIDKLKQIGISSVVITSLDPSLPLPPPEDIIREDTRVTAIHQVFDTYTRLQQNKEVDIPPLLSSSEEIIANLIDQPENLVQITDIRLYDDYTFAHSVNVAALSTLIGLLCHYSKADLITLSVGALLHDIGKLNVSLKILNKPTALTDDEFDYISHHPHWGAQRIKTFNTTKLDLDVISKIAYQHHEHLDGAGYPLHLMGAEIHPFAKIVAIADVYDALTTQRAYKKAYAPHIAYKIMTKCSGKQFDPHLLDLFFDHVALYPVGTVLQTALGYCIVKDVKVGMTQYPQLVLFTDSNHKLLNTPVTIECRDYGKDFIQTVIDGNNLAALCFKLRFNPSSLLISTDQKLTAANTQIVQ